MADLKQLFFNAVRNSQYADVQRGKMGILDSGGAQIIDVPGRPFHVYVRIARGGDETPAEAYNMTVAKKYGLPVFVGKTIDGKRAIIGIDQTAAAQQYDNATGLNVPLHGSTHWVLGTDPALVSPLQITNFRTYPANPLSLSVGVSEYLYYYNNTWKFFSGATEDLTSLVPTGSISTQRIIVVGLDKSTNTITTVNGVAKYVPVTNWYTMPFGLSDVQELLTLSAPANFEPSAVVRLYGGQTQIKQVDIFADCKISGGGAGGSTGGDWDVDLPPVTASAYDDDFNDASYNTGLWTTFDTGTVMTISETGTTISLSQPDVTDGVLTGARQTIPAGDFTLATKVQVNQDALTGIAHACQAGLVLWEDATGDNNKMVIVGPGVKSSGTTPRKGLGVSWWSGHNDLSALPVFWGTMSANTDYYIRLSRTGTSYVFTHSTDGITWGSPTTIGLTFTPTHFGIGIYNENTDATVTALFDFFRYRAVYDDVEDPVYGRLGGYVQSAGDTMTGELVIGVSAGDKAVTTSGIATLAGGMIINTTSIDNTDSPYTAIASDHMILGDTTSGSITVNLPAVSGLTGRVYAVKNTGSGTLTVDGNSSEEIDGATTKALAQNEHVQIVCDGAAWWII